MKWIMCRTINTEIAGVVLSFFSLLAETLSSCLYDLSLGGMLNPSSPTLLYPKQHYNGQCYKEVLPYLQQFKVFLSTISKC